MIDVDESRGLSGQAASGVMWTISQKWVIRITGLVTIAVLTRSLSPEDFGVVAVALSLLPLVQLLADLGFSTYLVQARSPSERTLSTAFWFSSVAGLVLTGALIASAPIAAWFLDTPEVAPVIQGLAPAALLVTLSSVPTALLRRELRFRAIAIQSVVAGVAGQAIAIALALAAYGVWALVAQTLVYQFIATALAWTAARWLPSRMFSRRKLREMAGFGVKVIGIEFVSLGRMWAENAIIVLALGTASLGYLSVAQRLVQIAQDLTTSALVPVSVVVFAKIRDSVGRLRSGYLRGQSVSYVLVIPIMLVVAVGAPWLIPLLFGDQWGASVVPAQILAIAGVFTLGALDHGLFFGLGKPGIWFVYAFVVEAATILTTLLMARHGLVAITGGFLGVAILATASRWAMVGHQLEAPWWRIAAPLGRCLAPAITAGGAAAVIGLLCADLTGILILAIIGLTIVAVYVPLVRWLMPAVWTELSDLATPALRKSGMRSRRRT